MKYYKNTSNEVFAYEEDGSQDALIDGKISMTTEEVEAHINPPKTSAQIKADIINAIQAMLDTKAQDKGYDNIISACSYAGYDNPFRAEGEAYGVWRALCWQAGYKILANIESGIREMQTIEEVIAEMPILAIA